MKKLLIAVAAAGFMLTACSSTDKPTENEAPVAASSAAPQISVEEAMAQCQQAGGQTPDAAAFDACMKDKGFQRNANQTPAAGAASAVQ